MSPSESISDPQLISAGFMVFWVSREGAEGWGWEGDWEPCERVPVVVGLLF